ncbi:MAG: CsbD family protein [Candidatus Krumholzibacteriia bacterium]
MGEHSDKAKGKAKESLGKATGDKEMEREGKSDRAAGKAKEGINKANEKAKETFGRKRDHE